MRSRFARCAAAVLVLPLAAAAFAACSGASAPTPAKRAPIVGNGKHYTVDGGMVAKSHWPNPCSLLPKSSGAAAVGTEVTVKRFHTNCFYIAKSAAFPNLTLTLNGLGTDLTGRFDSLRHPGARHAPRTVSGVGRDAFIYEAKVQPTTTLVVLGGGVLFSVALTTPEGAAIAAARVRSTLVAVAKPVAAEFSG